MTLTLLSAIAHPSPVMPDDLPAATPIKPKLTLVDAKHDGIFQARARLVEACVAQVYRIPHEALRASTRGKADVARARQVAMYVCHTTLGFSLTSVGHLFERDRTTVGHACRLVEDLRDEPDFDSMIICLERTVMAGCVPAPFRSRVAAGCAVGGAVHG